MLSISTFAHFPFHSTQDVKCLNRNERLEVNIKVLKKAGNRRAGYKIFIISIERYSYNHMVHRNYTSFSVVSLTIYYDLLILRAFAILNDDLWRHAFWCQFR
jgi:hypothetical protein